MQAIYQLFIAFSLPFSLNLLLTLKQYGDSIGILNQENMEIKTNCGKTVTLKPKADLSGLDLSGLDLSGADLEFANLENVNLEKAKLQNVNLLGANLYNSNLINIDLFTTNLEDADLEGAKFNDKYKLTKI